MRPPGVSTWDELEVLYPDMPVSPQGDRVSVRCRLRTAAFDDAVRLLAIPGAKEPLAWRLGLLANDLRRRWERWSDPRQQEEFGAQPGAPRSWLTAQRPSAWLLVPGGALLAIVPALWIRSYFAGVPGVVIAGAGLIGAFVNSRRRSVRSTTERRECPNCGYDLKGLNPAIPRAMLKGLDVGPSACPECGTRWPLVPPGDYPQGDRTVPASL